MITDEEMFAAMEGVNFLSNRLKETTIEEYDRMVEIEPTLKNMCTCSIEKFEIMLEKGFDVNQQDQCGSSLLGLLMSQHQITCINILLRFNPDVSLMNNEGQTIYFNLEHIAISREGINLVERLLSLDVNGNLIQTCDIRGLTILQQYNNILHLYINHGIDSTIDITPSNHMLNDSKIYRLKNVVIRIKNHIKRKTTLFSLMLQHLYE